jgi:hypothetical protein
MTTRFSRTILGLLALLCSSVGWAAVVNAVPSNANPNVGDTFSVTVSGVNFPQTLGATLRLTFNIAVVSVSGVELAPGSPFTGGLTATLPFNSGDSIVLLGPLTETLPSGNFDAFRINFKVLAPGNADIALAEDGADRVWLTEDNKPIPVTYHQARVQTAAMADRPAAPAAAQSVPSPSTATDTATNAAEAPAETDNWNGVAAVLGLIAVGVIAYLWWRRR